jgi:predicted DCC family thiol-disulfide oxidoreductase YuxK
VILFDGVCNLCASSVQFIIARDPKARFKFCSLQSQQAQSLLGSFAVRDLPDSVVLVDEMGKLHVKSKAALEIGKHLTWPWYWLAWLACLVPRPVRDSAYDLVARNRYRWFGRKEQCWMPTKELKERFLGGQ